MSTEGIFNEYEPMNEEPAIDISPGNININLSTTESNLLNTIVHLFNLFPSQEQFEKVILPWARRQYPSLADFYGNHKEFFDIIAPRIVGSAAIGVGLYKLKNFVTSTLGYDPDPPKRKYKKRGRYVYT